MWLSEKTTVKRGSAGACRVGTVESGGLRPVVSFEGESVQAKLAEKGAVYVPKAGDEVLTVSTDEGECFVAAPAADGGFSAENGELVIQNGGGEIRLKPGGRIELSGNIRLAGSLVITGSLTVNGTSY